MVAYHGTALPLGPVGFADGACSMAWVGAVGGTWLYVATLHFLFLLQQGDPNTNTDLGGKTCLLF
eukprot:2816160-Rhodomonas_salina.1